MTNEVNEISECAKESTIKSLPVPMNKTTRKRLKTLTGAYLGKYGRKINMKQLAGEILREAIKTAQI